MKVQISGEIAFKSNLTNYDKSDENKVVLGNSLKVIEEKDGKTFSSYFPFTCFGKQAKYLSTLKIGTQLIIDGDIKDQGQWTDETGNTRYSAKILVNSATIINGKSLGSNPINYCTVTGVLSGIEDKAVRDFGNGTGVLSFSIAESNYNFGTRGYDTSFLDVVQYGKIERLESVRDLIIENAKKSSENGRHSGGIKMVIRGKLKNNYWEKDGNKNTKLICELTEFVNLWKLEARDDNAENDKKAETQEEVKPTTKKEVKPLEVSTDPILAKL